MATKDTLQEDQNSFADSFNEDTPAPAEQSEDEAFGLNMPEADEVPDDNSGDNGNPALMIAIEAAPKDRPIIAAGGKGVVTGSRWLEKEGRWNMFTKAVPPLAWQPWPDHPGERSAVAGMANADVFG